MESMKKLAKVFNTFKHKHDDDLMTMQERFINALYKNNQVEVQNYLINNHDELDPNKINKNGLTALHICALKGHINLVHILLSFGVLINKAEKNGWTCLHTAAICGDSDMVHLLLKKGADPFLKSKTGQTAGDIASVSKVSDLIQHYMEKYTPLKISKMDIMSKEDLQIDRMIKDINNCLDKIMKNKVLRVGLCNNPLFDDALYNDDVAS